MGMVLGRVTIAAMKHHDQKQLGEERVYFILQFIGKGSHSSNSRQPATETEAMEEHCLLACSVLISQLSYTPQDRLSRCGTTHSELGTGLPQACLVEAISQSRIPLPKNLCQTRIEASQHID